MSKIIKCDGCEKIIDSYSKTETMEYITVGEKEYAIKIEVLSTFAYPELNPDIPSPYPAFASPTSKDTELNLCVKCFSEVIKALKDKLGKES